MNTKLKKTMKMAAAAIFILALAFNVKMSLDDPFAMVSQEVLANETGTGTDPGDGTGNDGNWKAEFPACAEQFWIKRITTRTFTTILDTGIELELGPNQFLIGSVYLPGNKVEYTIEETDEQTVPTKKRECVEGWGTCFTDDDNCEVRS